jgi:hypothetical protein
MKKQIFAALAVFALVLAATAGAHSESQTGKVAAVDPEGKGIVISVGKGDQALDVGTIIDNDTQLKVEGKNVPLSNLQDDVKVGDTVTLRYDRTDNLYAKQIVKR